MRSDNFCFFDLLSFVIFSGVGLVCNNDHRVDINTTELSDLINFFIWIEREREREKERERKREREKEGERERKREREREREREKEREIISSDLQYIYKYKIAT